MNLQEYRKTKNISVIKAAEELGISRQHIYGIEKGETYPSRKLSVAICKWSNGLVTVRELLFPNRSKLGEDFFNQFENMDIEVEKSVQVL